MAEDDVIEQDDSLEAAAEQFSKILSPDAPKEAAPATESQPEGDAPQEQSASAENGEETQAPADNDAPKPVIQPEAPATKSTDLDVRMQAATKAEQEANAARDKYLQQITVSTQSLWNDFGQKFPDIKTRADLFALANPQSATFNAEKYNAVQYALMTIQDQQQQVQRLQTEASAQRDQQIEKFQKEQFEKLPQRIPELADKDKGPAHAQRLREYALNEGYTDQQLKFASANDWALLNKAMLADERVTSDAAKAKSDSEAIEAAKLKAKGAPQVQKPGTPRTNSGKETKASEDFERLKRTGHVDDAAKVFQSILN